jgi:hypothetical protein
MYRVQTKLFGLKTHDFNDKYMIYVTGLNMSNLLLVKIVYYCVQDQFPLCVSPHLADRVILII